MSEVFNFTCYINPPTKNEKTTISVYSKRARRKVPIVNPAFKQVWELIHSEMYKCKFGISKQEFKLLTPKKRAELEKSLTEKDVRLNFWNGFKRLKLAASWLPPTGQSRSRRCSTAPRPVCRSDGDRTRARTRRRSCCRPVGRT